MDGRHCIDDRCVRDIGGMSRPCRLFLVISTTNPHESITRIPLIFHQSEQHNLASCVKNCSFLCGPRLILKSKNVPHFL